MSQQNKKDESRERSQHAPSNRGRGPHPGHRDNNNSGSSGDRGSSAQGGQVGNKWQGAKAFVAELSGSRSSTWLTALSAIVIIVLLLISTWQAHEIRSAVDEAKKSADTAKSTSSELKKSLSGINQRVEEVAQRTERLGELPTQIKELKALPDVLSKAVESMGQADAKIQPYTEIDKRLTSFTTDLHATDQRIASVSSSLDNLGSQLVESGRTLRDTIRLALDKAKADQAQRFLIPLVIHQWTATAPTEGGGTTFVYNAPGLLDHIISPGKGNVKTAQRVEVQDITAKLHDVVVSTAIEDGGVLTVRLWTRLPEQVTQLSASEGVRLDVCVAAE